MAAQSLASTRTTDPSSTGSGRAPRFWRLAAFVGAYFICQELAFFIPGARGLVAAVWPAAGVALAALLLSPRRDWPTLLALFFFTGMAANLTTSRPWYTGLGFMVANLCETAASAILITRWCGTHIRFQRIKDMTSLLAVATLVNGATSFLGAGTAVELMVAP